MEAEEVKDSIDKYSVTSTISADNIPGGEKDAEHPSKPAKQTNTENSDENKKNYANKNDSREIGIPNRLWTEAEEVKDPMDKHSVNYITAADDISEGEKYAEQTSKPAKHTYTKNSDDCSQTGLDVWDLDTNTKKCSDRAQVKIKQEMIEASLTSNYKEGEDTISIDDTLTDKEMKSHSTDDKELSDEDENMSEDQVANSSTEAIPVRRKTPPKEDQRLGKKYNELNSHFTENDMENADGDRLPADPTVASNFSRNYKGPVSTENKQKDTGVYKRKSNITQINQSH